MSWLYPIDWSATIAGGSAIVATGALVWNVWWSQERTRRERLNKLGDAKLQWIEGFRSDFAEYVSLLLVARKKYLDPELETYDEGLFLKTMNAHFRVLLQIPPGNYHFDEFRTKLYDFQKNVASMSKEEMSKMAIDLEFSAGAIIEVERELANRNFKGLSND